MANALTPLQKEVAKDIYVSFLVTGNNKYGYYAVRADKLDEFQQFVSTDGTFEVPEYAVLLTRGTGAPSELVKQRMEEEYNFSHDFINDLKKQAAA